MPATRNRAKLDCASATIAASTATTADNEASAKPRLRPMRRISSVAGIVVAATATTIMDTGSVASALFVTSEEPMMPPSVTMTIDPVAEINWQQTRMIRLVLFIRSVAREDAAFSHIKDASRAYNSAVIHDLHMHSTASDGSLAPAALVDHVVECGVSVMSITDHDTTAAYNALADNTAIHIVPGVELSTTWLNRGIHVVGLSVDRDNEILKAGLAAQVAARGMRAQAIAARLAKLGLDCPLDAVEPLREVRTADGRSASW